MRVVLLLAVAILVVAALAILGVGEGHFAGSLSPGQVAAARVPEDAIAARSVRQDAPREALSVADDKQILFGDLHVHTTFSSDAFLFSLPVTQGEGARPPADACDFARFCSQLDFWSINDHAELLTPEQWRLTKESIRDCNAVAGDPQNPDTVAFLGWEWTNAGRTAAEHYGHKNVIFRDTEDDRVPMRPIGVTKGQLADAILRLPMYLRTGLPFYDPSQLGWYLEFNRFVRLARDTPECAIGVDVRELPDDCIEYAPTPALLFEKLDQWGFDALVIPHGTSWGIHAPAGADIATQLAQHDSQRQRLIEVFSGHGNSEVYRPWRAREVAADGTLRCPEPSDDYTPCCWRAGELIRERCSDDISPEECERRVEKARQTFVDMGIEPMRFHMVTGATAEDWGECGTLQGGFLPAYIYRAGMATQAALATGPTEPGPSRFRFGLIGSSDNHSARPGTGYKEYAREFMTDAWGVRQDILDLMTDELAPQPEIVPFDEMKRSVSELQPLQPERGASFYYTGGLAAVHASGRDRDSIFDALEMREVYGTSGQRQLLWFDLLHGDDDVSPMGSEVELAEPPRFRVRAAGAFKQKPGCPEFSLDGLGTERAADLCRGECYHPSDQRLAITRIEVVRIRPQESPDEDRADLIEDPWRVFPCEGDSAGCVVEFVDPDFVRDARESVYYVRAIQEPTLTMNGDPLRCERDASGACVGPRPCYASGPRDADDDCLHPVEHRAWSSPIFIDPESEL